MEMDRRGWSLNQKAIAIFLVTSSLIMIVSSLYFKEWYLLRLGLFIGTLGTGFLSTNFCLFLSILAIPSLEIPTLLAGIPNQFLIDWILLGAGAHLFRNFSQYKNHVLIPSLLLLASAMIFAFIPEFISWVNLAEGDFSLIRAIKSFGKSFFLWDIETNPFHSLSVSFGIFTSCFFVIGISNWLKENGPHSRLKIIEYLSVSSVIPFIWGILQLPTIAVLPLKYTADIGGTFQNGNLLSFFAGLIIYLQLIAFSLQTKPLRRAFHFVILGLAVFCLFLGQGRTGMLALIVAGICIVPLTVRLDLSKIRKTRFTAALLLLLSVALGSIFFLDFGNFSGFVELQDIFQNKKFTDILYAGGRHEVYRLGAQFLSENWLHGMGQGYFFNKAGLNLELHSIIPDWILGVGLPIAILCFAPLIFRLPFLVKSINTSQELPDKLIAVACIYIAISTLPDHYFSYRPMLVSSLIVLALIDSTFITQFSNKTFLLLMIFILSFALSAMNSPHFRPLVMHIYPKESQSYSFGEAIKTNNMIEYDFTPLGEFNWVSLGARFEVGKECKGFLLNSPFNESGHRIAVRVTDRNDIRPDINSFQATKIFKSADQIELFQGRNRWRSICFCNSENQTKFLYFLSSRANYISFSKSLNTPDDNRYIGFKMSQFQPNLDITASNSEKSLPIACERINI